MLLKNNALKAMSKSEMKNVFGGNMPTITFEDGKNHKCCIGNECTECQPSVSCGPKATLIEC